MSSINKNEINWIGNWHKNKKNNDIFIKDKSNKISIKPEDLWDTRRNDIYIRKDLSKTIDKNDKKVGGINNLVTRIITRRILLKLAPIHTENKSEKSKKTVITKKVKKTKKNEKNEKNEKTKKLKKSKKSKKSKK